MDGMALKTRRKTNGHLRVHCFMQLYASPQLVTGTKHQKHFGVSNTTDEMLLQFIHSFYFCKLHNVFNIIAMANNSIIFTSR